MRMRSSYGWALAALMANLTTVVSLSYSQAITKHKSCPEKCGEVTIPYPFGIGKSCALDEEFIINCNHTYNPPSPFLGMNDDGDPIKVLDISLTNGTMRVSTYVASNCYNRNLSFESYGSISKFFFSPTRNYFIVVGCNADGNLAGKIKEVSYASGCKSFCLNESIVINGSCSGIGCCQTTIPPGLSECNIMVNSYDDTRKLEFNNCSYAFVTDADNFNFSTDNLRNMSAEVPTVIDWQIGTQNCQLAAKNVSSYACKEHSKCRDSKNGPGYLCLCNQGYEGNPYVHGGCVDVDECKTQHDCVHDCHNSQGTFTCSCRNWYLGDGKKIGQGCTFNTHRLIVVLVVGGALLTLIIAAILILNIYRRQRMRVIRKHKFFKQNGGFILLDRISRNKVGSNSISTIRIFKSKELKKATDNYSESRICGRGGFGTVYKGNLSNGSVVAIKKSKVVDQDQIEQFINEITILSQINHKNVVKFLGCCLETQVPLLVYEFITNGTLSDHIHNDNGNRPKFPWKTRLKVATETAGVLAYLHIDHSPQIIHRDIKPTNILLDEDYTSKVSDFGASRLNLKNENEICTMVKGTLGYLDPEYLETSHLTEKSDVYSFGVVLVELLTGLKVVSFDRLEEDQNLVLYFLSLTKEDEILAILDKAIMMNEENIEEIKQVLKIAKMCTRVKGEERPTMKEVAMELEGLHENLKHKWVTNKENFEEEEHLLGEVSPNPYGKNIQMTAYSGQPEDI